MKIRNAALAATMSLICSFPAAAATMYCCTDANGRKACGDILPPACYGRAYREISEKGSREIEAPLTPEQRAQREAEEKRKKHEEQLATAERLRNRALLDTYGNVEDIDYMRDRTVADLGKGLKSAQEKANEALQRKQQLDKEAEFYKKKAMPDDLAAQIRSNKKDLQATQDALTVRQQEIADVKAKFEAEKLRYIELTRGSSPGKSTPQKAPLADEAAAKPR
jgi:hypothetical protein